MMPSAPPRSRGDSMGRLEAKRREHGERFERFTAVRGTSQCSHQNVRQRNKRGRDVSGERRWWAGSARRPATAAAATGQSPPHPRLKRRANCVKKYNRRRAKRPRIIGPDVMNQKCLEEESQSRNEIKTHMALMRPLAGSKQQRPSLTSQLIHASPADLSDRQGKDDAR